MIFLLERWSMASVLLVAKLALWDDPASADSFDSFKDADLDGKAINSRLASFLTWRHALFLTGSVGWIVFAALNATTAFNARANYASFLDQAEFHHLPQ